MGTIGELKIDPNEALNKADNIRSYAGTVHDILDVMSKKMNEIDDEGAGIYQGTAKSRELREQLNMIKTNFEPIYNQMMAFSEEIKIAANKALNQ